MTTSTSLNLVVKRLKGWGVLLQKTYIYSLKVACFSNVLYIPFLHDPPKRTWLVTKISLKFSPNERSLFSDNWAAGWAACDLIWVLILYYKLCKLQEHWNFFILYIRWSVSSDLSQKAIQSFFYSQILKYLGKITPQICYHYSGFSGGYSNALSIDISDFVALK